MCGLTGGWTLRDPGELQRQLRGMTSALSHRGPDSDGLWFDGESGFGLGHARLAIVDLSPQGHQPMASASGRFVLAYNGEIYNHADLRRELERAGSAPAWRGHSDTETLLAAIERWGVERTLQRCIGMFAIALWDRRERELWLARDRLGEKPLYYGLRKERMLRLASALESQEPDGTYGRMVTHWEDSTTLVPGSRLLESVYDGVDWHQADAEFPELLGRLDLEGYLADDILVKVDRAAMSVSLETRIPMLDHRVVEFAQSLPPNIKWHHGEGKWPLRELLRRHVPAGLVDRPKRGFGVPTAQWLRGPLRDWAEDLLSERSLGADGLLDPAPIRRCWQEHLSGRRDAHIELWDVLMLQAWLRERAPQPAAALPPEPLPTSVGWR